VRAHRIVKLAADGGRLGVEEVLEVTVTWDEFNAIAERFGHGAARHRAIVEYCRIIFDPETFALVHAYVSEHGHRLPMFAPEPRVGATRALRALPGGR
jgi:hypothetical protein